MTRHSNFRPTATGPVLTWHSGAEHVSTCDSALLTPRFVHVVALTSGTVVGKSVKCHKQRPNMGDMKSDLHANANNNSNNNNNESTLIAHMCNTQNGKPNPYSVDMCRNSDKFLKTPATFFHQRHKTHHFYVSSRALSLQNSYIKLQICTA